MSDEANGGAATKESGPRKRRVVTEPQVARADTERAIANAEAEKEAAEAKQERRRGRPRKPPPPMVSPIGETKVQHIPIDELDLDDETFMFRAALRTGELKNSILAHGQQMPIVVLGRSRGQRKYRVISGFRRANAIREIGWDTVAAIVRTDLDDEAAFRASVLENTARKTYTDLDKAYVMKTLQDRGMGSEEVATLMGLKVRQKNNIMSLLKMPQVVQNALADVNPSFTTTHALLLRQMAGRYEQLDYAYWIRMCLDTGVSISQLKRAINAKYRPQADKGFTTIFNDSATDWDKGEIRLMPIRLSLAALSSEDRDLLKKQLRRLVERL